MLTHLAIDSHLIETARKLGGQKTNEAVGTEALLDYIQKRQQAKIVQLFGTVDYDADYDFRAARQQR